MSVFTFCPCDIGDVSVDIFRKEIEALSNDYWHYDKFRNCYILSMWNPGAQSGQVDPKLQGENKFTEAALKCPKLVEWISPLLYKLNGRLTVLKTLPSQFMNVHLDCRVDEIGTEQYKWRMVVKGNKNGLYFLNENNDRVYPNKNYPVYVMDGGHPHGIDQDDSEEKITVCIGAKWRGTPMVDNLIESEKVTIERGSILDEWGMN